MKIQQKHGMTNDESSLIHLRTSMRKRMSRSYIGELRGSNAQNLNPQIEVIDDVDTDGELRSQISSLSLPPQVHFYTKIPSVRQSAITLDEHQKLNSTHKSCLTEKSIIEIDKPTQPPVKGNTQLLVPPVGDYCLRISNTPSMFDDEQSELVLNDTRVSDALGYLHMYNNQNRIQFGTLQFNDREDLQVRRKFNIHKKHQRFFCCYKDSNRWSVWCTISAYFRS